MKTPYARFLYYALAAFGTLTLALAVFYAVMKFLCQFSPTAVFHSGGYNPIELFGFGLLSLGLARVLKLLEER